jgi:hypothetical protein
MRGCVHGFLKDAPGPPLIANIKNGILAEPGKYQAQLERDIFRKNALKLLTLYIVPNRSFKQNIPG